MIMEMGYGKLNLACHIESIISLSQSECMEFSSHLQLSICIRTSLMEVYYRCCIVFYELCLKVSVLFESSCTNDVSDIVFALV